MDQHLYELLHQCTVHISVPEKTEHGTGLFVAPGLILTCAHVVKAAQPGTTPVDVYWKGQTFSANITQYLPGPDLALVQINLADHPCVYLNEEAVPFDDLYSYGYSDTHPDGDPATFSLEGMAGEQRVQYKFKMGQVRPGMSGAPLLNVRTGHVCGVVQLTRDRNNDLGGRAISTTTVFQAFPELVAQQQLFHGKDRSWLNCLWEFAARTKYLEEIIRRYSSVTLPIGPAEGFSLQDIFQPLTLRHDPLEVEMRKPMSMQALRGEPGRDGEVAINQPVVVKNGEDALKRSPKGRIVVLGGPGTGKTTTLKFLAEDRSQQALADIAAPVPLFISLPDLARSGKTLLHYVKGLVEDMGVESRYADVLWKEIEAGKTFVCMDGLDEVEPLHRPRMIELINGWATRSGNTWVIGSRFTEYKGGQFKQAQFAEWELLPMNYALRMELAQRLFPELQRLLLPVQHGTSLSAESFVSVLEQHPQASAWGENPLLFSLAAVVFTQTRGLPASRTALYHDVIGAVIEMREQNSLWRHLMLHQLTEFAFWLHQTKGRTFTNNDLLTFILEIQRKPEAEAADLSYRIISSGMVDVVGRKSYNFRHQTFQEYLTASELAHRLTSQDAELREETWNFAWSKRTYSRWAEVLRLMIGILVLAGSVGKSLAQRWLQLLMMQRETEDGDPGNLALMLALGSLVEVAELPEWDNLQAARLGEQIISTSIKEVRNTLVRSRDTVLWSRDSTSEQLESVARELSYLRGILSRMVIEQCLNLLQGTDEDAHKVAIEILIKQGERVPLEPLLYALENHNAPIREAALKILVEGERVPLELLLHSLYDDARSVRDVAAQALEKQGERVPLEPLLIALENQNADIREAALKTLANQGGRVPMEPLLLALYDTEQSVRDAAAEALKKQGERVPMEPLLHALKDRHLPHTYDLIDVFRVFGERLPLEPLLDCLMDEDLIPAVIARNELIERGARVPVEALLRILRGANWKTYDQVYFVLAEQSERLPLEALLEVLQDENWVARYLALRLLGDREAPKLVQKLPPSSKREDPNIRPIALETSNKQSERVPAEPLLAALNDTHTRVIEEAMSVLGDRLSQDYLSGALQDQNERIRIGALKALGAHGSNAKVELVLSALRDRSEVVRGQAIETLSTLKTHGASVPPEWLRVMLDTDFALHLDVEKALKVMSEYMSQEVLVEVLQEERGLHYAEIILKPLAEHIHARTLLELILSDYAGIRCTAIYILGAQGKQCPVEIILASLQDRHARVRRAAVEVLGKLKRLANKELLIALRDENTSVRQAAVQVLQALGERAP